MIEVEMKNAARVEAGGVQEISASFQLTPARHFRAAAGQRQARHGRQRSIQMAQCYALSKDLLLKPRSWGPAAPVASVRAFRYLQAWRSLCGAPCVGLSDLDLWRMVLDAKAHLQGAGRWGCVIPLASRRGGPLRGASDALTVH